MAGVCVPTSQFISKGFSTNTCQIEQVSTNARGSLWRQDPMLPLECLMDAKPDSRYQSSEIALREAGSPSRGKTKRTGKKKLLKKRKSSSSSSVTLSLSSWKKNSDVVERAPSQTHAPKVSLCSGRIDELSMPPLRSSNFIQNMGLQTNERKKRLSLLSAIKPENEKVEKERFMRAGFNYNPYFAYRSPADEETMERFNTPSDRYLDIAVHVMELALNQFGTYEAFEEKTGGKILSKAEIISLVRKYLKKEDMESEIQVNLSEDLLSRGSMTQKKGRPQLNVRVVNLREDWCHGLLRHELGTHYLRSINNRLQVWGQWKQRRELCLQHFNPTEEGLASLHSVLFREHPFLWRAALLYYVANKAAHMSFKDLFTDLGRFVHSPAVRWDYCVRAKRGQSDTSLPGAFCKDQVYLEGALQLLKRRRSLDFHLLVRMGKIAFSDIEKLIEHCQLEGTRIPSFMNDLTEYRKQLNHIAATNGLTDDLLREVE